MEWMECETTIADLEKEKKTLLKRNNDYTTISNRISREKVTYEDYFDSIDIKYRRLGNIYLTKEKQYDNQKE